MNNNKLATSNPKTLTWNPLYWLQNELPFVGLLILSVLISGLLFPFIFHEQRELEVHEKWGLNAVSVAIYIFTIWGILIIAKSIVLICVEKSIASKVASNLGTELSKIRGKEKDKISLDRIVELLPNTSSKFSSDIIRLVNYIVFEAKDRKFYSSEVVTRTYKEETYKELFKVSSTQKIALRLGILGTFIGLIMAFIGLGNPEDTSESFQSITSALEYSFGTSIAGLQGSIILALFMLLLHRKRESYFKEMEEAAQVTIALSRNSINKDEFLASFDQMKVSLEEVRDSVYDQKVETSLQTKAIKNGMSKLNRSKAEFDQFLTKISSEMARVYEILSPEKIGIELKESMKTSIEGISKVLDENLSGQLEKYDSFVENMELLGEGLHKIEDQLKGQLELNERVLENPRRDAYEAVSSLSKTQESYLSQISEIHPNKEVERYVENLQKGLANHLKQNTTEIVKTVSRLEKSIAKYNKIIDARVPTFSLKKVLLLSFLSFGAITFLVLYFTDSYALDELKYFFDSLF